MVFMNHSPKPQTAVPGPVSALFQHHHIAQCSAEAGPGEALEPGIRSEMEDRFGADFSRVRVHHDGRAADLAEGLSASACTIGQHVFFQAGAYDPSSRSGYATLAHELTHTLQQGSAAVPPGQGSPVAVTQPSDPAERVATTTADRLAATRDRPSSGAVEVDQVGDVVCGGQIMRQTAQEVVTAHTTLGAFVDSAALGTDLVGLLRAGQYAVVADALRLASRSAVVNQMLRQIKPLELIGLARTPAARPALSTMADELGKAWFGVGSTNNNYLLLQAVLGDPTARRDWNEDRIRALHTAGSDLAALVAMFDDDQIIDDGSLTSRLDVILAATEHLLIPGLQTGIEFGDTGFAGDQRLGGSGFRDPWPASRNQVGHFLTAVGLEYSPSVVSRHIPLFGSIRSMVGAPATMSDSEVALRLTIGHEKAADPAGAVAAFTSMVASGFVEALLPGPEGETDEQRDERIGAAIANETRRQVNDIIAAFRRQFTAVTDQDISAWNRALGQLGPQFNQSAIEGPTSPLGQIQVGTGQGNSIQDLRLSLAGWQFGQMIWSGQFTDRHAAAAWLRAHLGAAPGAPR